MSSLRLTVDLTEQINALGEYFSYSFVRNALIMSVLVALCASLLGVFLVLKRYSALGDGLSHVAFGAAAVAATLGILDFSLTLPVTILAAILILYTKADKRIMGDALIAMVSVGALAIGYTVMSLGGGAANLGGDVCTALFGSSAILAVDTAELVTVSLITVTLVALAAIFYYKLVAVSFDEKVADATGTRVGVYNLAIAVICAIVIVIGMKIAGALLISALIVIPALCAMRVCKSFGGVLVCSAVLACVCAVLGVLASAILKTPVGATIAAVDIVCYGMICLFSRRK